MVTKILGIIGMVLVCLFAIIGFVVTLLVEVCIHEDKMLSMGDDYDDNDF